VRNVKAFVGGLALVMVATLLTLGCSGAGGGATTPSTGDVRTAFSAMGSALGTAPKAESVAVANGVYATTVYDGRGGSMGVSYSTTGDPKAGPVSILGTLTLSNLRDPSSGCVFNGTITINETTGGAVNTYPLMISVGLACNLSVTGGSVSTLACNITESIAQPSAASSPAVTVSGTITADGYTFDVTKL